MRGVERAVALLDQARDFLFVGAPAVAVNDLRGSRDLLRRGGGDSEHFGESLAFGGGGGHPGQSKQHGALALAQVVSRWLAGYLGIPEDSEVVIAQLEGQAPRGEDLLEGVGERGSGLDAGRPADRAQNRRVDDRIVGRLVEGDFEGVARAQGIRALRVEGRLFGRNIQVLAQRHLRVHVGEASRERFGAFITEAQSLAVGRRGRRGEEEVADEDCAVAAKVGR
mgnify:CR=1 FL=1